MKPFQLYPKSLAHLACKSPPALRRGRCMRFAHRLFLSQKPLAIYHLPFTIYRAGGAGTSAVGAGKTRSRGV